MDNMQWQYYLLVFAGGGSGSMLRLMISRQDFLQGKSFFIATLAANLIACFILGLIAHRYTLSPNRDWSWYLFAAGFCGGLSTFSTFSLETLELLGSGQWQTALIYTSISILGCLLALWAGISVSPKIY